MTDIVSYDGTEIYYGDDGTKGRHVFDGEGFDTAEKPGWYWADVEAKGGAFTSDHRGPFLTAALAISDLCDTVCGRRDYP